MRGTPPPSSDPALSRGSNPSACARRLVVALETATGSTAFGARGTLFGSVPPTSSAAALPPAPVPHRGLSVPVGLKYGGESDAFELWQGLTQDAWTLVPLPEVLRPVHEASRTCSQREL